MGGRSKIGRILINAAIFILMEIAALSMLRNSSATQQFFITKGVHNVIAKVWGGAENIHYYFNLRQANEALSRENFELNRRLSAFLEDVEKAKRDSLTTTYSFHDDYVYTPADIIKMSRNTQHNYIILSQGSDDGVKPQAGIITRNGVIGIVDAVSKHYSYAISFMNTSFSLSARLGREGAVGPLVWDGKSTDGALLREIPLQNRFEPGDTVFTSGHSSIFPPDIPVGITGESRIVNGATYEIDVKLLQDFSSVRYVTLVNNKGRKEIETLEKEAQHEK